MYDISKFFSAARKHVRYILLKSFYIGIYYFFLFTFFLVVEDECDVSLHFFLQSTVDWNFRSNMHKKASADYIGGKGFDPAVTVVDAGNYDEIVANSDKDVLFDLYAPWCILCARNKPVYEELAKRISEVING